MERGPIDIQELIARINGSERLRRSAHFSDTVHDAEPLVRTGRQMANYLPERYREMRAVSRYDESGRRGGRWLSEAELFFRQARIMEDFEDDCPYHGRFASYFPTYNAMSDQQLRGYFTWRARVRRGEVEQTSLSFAYVYLYELLCGIGVENPADGFEKIRSFWRAYREFAPDIDRYVRGWLRDYVVYHGLDPALLAGDPVIAADRAVAELIRMSAPFDPALAGGPTPKKPPVLPLPPQEAAEARLVAAIETASSYRISQSRLFREHERDLVHVACAVYVRMLSYYRKNRKAGLIETLFGELAETPVTLFGSAVFFEERRHPDTEYALDPVRIYRCRDGFWTCRRHLGATERSQVLGAIMRAVDRKLRIALDFEPRLQERAEAKYLERIIDREIETWLAWKTAHAPRTVKIDLSKLDAIREAADATREALLTDEERAEEAPAPRESEAPTADDAPAPQGAPAGEAASTRPAPPASDLPRGPLPAEPPADPREEPASAAAAMGALGLAPEEVAFLQALLAGEPPAGGAASDDLIVDAINEKLFDAVGDTVIEFGDAGPRLIDDYLDDLKGLMAT